MVVLRALGLFALIVAVFWRATFTSDADLPPRGRYDPASHPALGCWQVSARRPIYRYLETPLRVRLTPDLQPYRRQPTLTADSAEIAHRELRILFWVPLDSAKRAYLFWGDGHTGVGLEMRMRGDTMTGRSILTTDFGWPRRGPRARAVRVAC